MPTESQIKISFTETLLGLFSNKTAGPSAEMQLRNIFASMDQYAHMHGIDPGDMIVFFRKTASIDTAQIFWYEAERILECIKPDHIFLHYELPDNSNKYRRHTVTQAIDQLNRMVEKHPEMELLFSIVMRHEQDQDPYTKIWYIAGWDKEGGN